MKCKKMRDMMSVAVLLLALAVPSAATGQTDGFFNSIESVYRSDTPGGSGSWMNFVDNTGGEATWEGFDNGNPLPTGTGLLVMALSGACYAGAKVKRVARSVKRVVRRD